MQRQMLPEESRGWIVWHHLILNGYLNGDTNLFQSVGNSRRRSIYPNGQYGPHIFNFAYGWNGQVPNEKSLKLSQIVSSSDHIQLSDTVGG